MLVSNYKIIKRLSLFIVIFVSGKYLLLAIYKHWYKLQVKRKRSSKNKDTNETSKAFKETENKKVCRIAPYTNVESDDQKEIEKLKKAPATSILFIKSTNADFATTLLQ